MEPEKNKIKLGPENAIRTCWRNQPFVLHCPSGIRVPFWGGSQISYAEVNCTGKPCVIFSVTLVQVFLGH